MAFFLELEDDALLVLEGNHEFYILLEDCTPVADQVEISLPKTTFLEESVFTLTVFFRTRSTATASTPTSIRYRIDDLRSKREIRDWTSVSAAPNVDIVITSSDNEIQDDATRFETKQIIVQADNGLTTQVNGKAIWKVKNLTGIT